MIEQNSTQLQVKQRAGNSCLPKRTTHGTVQCKDLHAYEEGKGYTDQFL